MTAVTLPHTWLSASADDNIPNRHLPGRLDSTSKKSGQLSRVLPLLNPVTLLLPVAPPSTAARRGTRVVFGLTLGRERGQGGIDLATIRLGWIDINTSKDPTRYIRCRPS